MLRAWPRLVSLTIGLVPVIMLSIITALLCVKGWPAVSKVGWSELAGTHFSSLFLSGKAQYGLAPAALGSLLIVATAMAIALPVSMAMAIFSAELAPGVLRGVMRSVLGILAGIPPIVYAFMSVLFVKAFMIPKFTAGFTYTQPQPGRLGVATDQWPPFDVPWGAGAFPWNPTGLDNSTLLGGILLSFLAIPFMAPLIEDALRNVPADPKQASLALGASHWETLRRVTIPHAMAGIVSAIRLGTLKVLGDVIIVLFVVGWSAPRIPNPPWDVLERTAPLTATGAGLLGGLGSPQVCGGNDCAVGYFTALLLLVAAVAIVLLSTVLERYFRRRIA